MTDALHEGGGEFVTMMDFRHERRSFVTVKIAINNGTPSGALSFGRTGNDDRQAQSPCNWRCREGADFPGRVGCKKTSA
jgi:hypothetical protein